MFRPTGILGIAAATVVLTLVGPASAQQRERNYNLTDRTGEELAKVQPLLNAKDWKGALAIIDAQLPRAEKSGYDMAILQQVKAQILLQNSQYSQAIAPLEACLNLSDAAQPNYFDQKASLEYVYYLAQLNYQEATTTKDPALARRYFDKAEAFMERWTTDSPKPSSDILLFYASLLYNRAVQDSASSDIARIERAIKLVETAMRLNTRPKDSLIVLKLACLLQMNRPAEAAEVLELILKDKPESRSYWQQLAAIYLNVGQDIRSIVTIERAQANGHMNTPKDNFNLVGIHFNIGQFEKAAELLETGLKDGSIENEQKNWELLSYSYQQLRRERKSIDALERAAKNFPTAGQLEYMIAQAYYGLEKPKDALAHAEAAIKKGSLNRPHQAYLFAAYLSFELKEFDKALEFVNRAVEIPEGKEEGERMKKAITDAITEREARLSRM